MIVTTMRQKQLNKATFRMIYAARLHRATCQYSACPQLNQKKKRYHDHGASLYSIELSLKMNDRISSPSYPIAEMITRERSLIVKPAGICQLINSSARNIVTNK